MRAPRGISSAGQLVGVAVAVPALVRVADERPDRREELDRLEDPLADERVGRHLGPLLLGQGPGLVQEARRDRELADVVERGGVAEHPQLLAAPAEQAPDRHRVVGDRRRVRGGVGVLRLERGRERLGGSHVSAVELLVEPDGGERAADLGGDRLEQPAVVGVERPHRDVLEVDEAPHLVPVVDRDHQLGAHLAGGSGRAVLRLAGHVTGEHRSALAQRPADQADVGALAPSRRGVDPPALGAEREHLALDRDEVDDGAVEHPLDLLDDGLGDLVDGGRAGETVGQGDAERERSAIGRVLVDGPAVPLPRHRRRDRRATGPSRPRAGRRPDRR